MKLEVFKGCVLHSGYPWVEHKFGDRDAILDGRFTADELREIADAMDANATKAAWEAECRARAEADAKLAIDVHTQITDDSHGPASADGRRPRVAALVSRPAKDPARQQR